MRVLLLWQSEKGNHGFAVHLLDPYLGPRLHSHKLIDLYLGPRLALHMYRISLIA